MSGSSQGNGTPFWFYPVTWLLVVVGWLIVNWQNNRREERKEIRTALNQIYTDIENLQKKATKYHKSATRNVKLETKIIVMERKLSEHLSYLRLRDSSFGPSYSLFIDAITLNNFESPTFVQQTSPSEILENIQDYSIELESALELEFSKLFRGGFIVKTITLVKQIKEQGTPTGAIFNFIEKWQAAIITIIAYLFFTLFMGYVVSLVPAK